MTTTTKENILILIRRLKNAISAMGLKGFFYKLVNEISFSSPWSVVKAKLHGPWAYAQWRKMHDLSSEDVELRRGRLDAANLKPLVSVVIPVWNTPVEFLERAINSVQNQIYQNWQLCIADDCSSRKDTVEFLKRLCKQNSRIDCVFRSVNGHISQASNSALEMARGEFVVLLDHDDALAPEALCDLVLELNEYPEADLIYSDEDKIDENGVRISPFFKPDWSPDTLLSRMYISHLTMYRNSIVKRVGGFREGLEGAQDHDLALRVTELTDNVRHIPRILYHWRVHENSTSKTAGVKNYAREAGLRAVNDALSRRGEVAEVHRSHSFHGGYEVRYIVEGAPLVSILIPTRDQPELLDGLLTSLFERTRYPAFEVLQIDNGSKRSDTLNVFKKWERREPARYRVIRCDIPFNFSRINNYGAKQAKGEFLLFLNDDMEVKAGDWLGDLLGQAQRLVIGAVGAKLLYPDGSIQHAGIVLGIGEFGIAGHSHRHHTGTTTGYFGNVATITNFSAVTGACLMCSKANFEKVGGFDEDLSIAFNDIDLCLKFKSLGLNNVYLPHVELYHHESKSRGYEDSAEKRQRLKMEGNILRKKWSSWIDNDPFYNPNLTRKNEDFSYRLSKDE